MLDALLRWIISESPKLPLEGVLAGLGERLLRERIQLDRLWCGVMEVNPLSVGYSLVWRPGEPVERYTPAHLERESERARGRHGGGTIVDAGTTGFGRLRLDQVEPGSWGLPRVYWDEKYTDVVALGTPRSRIGSATMLTFATRSPQGFSEPHVNRLRELREPLGLVCDLRSQELLTQTLARTYLGADVGHRVLSGQIRRGDGVTITAALWFSDLRGFTSLADRISRDELIHLLDDAFEAQVAAVEENGGEVLKFIGDGLMAIFPTSDEISPQLACRRALTAAEAFEERLSAVNTARQARGLRTIEYGLALHFGDVMYGNIGAPGRLDFTVIGPAVNLAARLEGVAAQLGRQVVLSSEFAAHAGCSVTSAGHHTLRGVAAPCEVFVPSSASRRSQAAPLRQA